MSAAEVTCHSRTEGSNDRSTTVTGHSVQAGLVALGERLLVPEVSGCARPTAAGAAHEFATRKRSVAPTSGGLMRYAFSAPGLAAPARILQVKLGQMAPLRLSYSRLIDGASA